MTGDGKHSTPQTWLSLGMMMMMMMMMMMADGFPQMLRLEDGRTLSDYNIQKAMASPTLFVKGCHSGQRSCPRSPRCTWCCVFAVVSLSLLWPSLGGKMSKKKPENRNTVHVIRLDWWEHLQEARGLTCSDPSQPFFMIHSPGFHGQLKHGRISPRCLPESSTARRWFAASAMLASMFLGQMAGTWQVAGQPWVWVKRMDPKMTKCVCLLVNWFNWMV